MEIKEALPIVLIFVGVIGTVVSGFVTEIQIFKANPEYEIKTLNENFPVTKSKELMITNTGLVQANNATMYVISDNPINEKENVCFEGHISSYSDNIIQINFPKMSIGIPCEISFQSLENSIIKRVVITSDGSPGYNFYPKKLEQSSSIFNEDKGEFVNDKEEVVIFKDIASDDFSKYLPWLLILYTISISVSFAYFLRRRKMISKAYQILQKEYENKLKKFQDELDYIYKENVNNEITSNHLKKRIRWLENKILIEKTNLDESSAKTFTPTNPKSIENYFEKWKSVEKNLHQKILEKQIDLGGDVTISHINKELFSNEVTDKNFYSSLNSSINFRNKVSHGLIKSISVSLEKEIKRLETLPII